MSTVLFKYWSACPLLAFLGTAVPKASHNPMHISCLWEPLKIDDLIDLEPCRYHSSTKVYQNPLKSLEKFKQRSLGEGGVGKGPSLKPTEPSWGTLQNGCPSTGGTWTPMQGALFATNSHLPSSA